MQPEQERPFGGIPQCFYSIGIGKIEKRGRIDSNTLFNEIFNLLLVEKRCFVNPHLVLRERTSFIGTNNSGSAHRFARMHLAHQVVGREHTLHTQSKAEGNAHGKPFGDSHHNYRYSNHSSL